MQRSNNMAKTSQSSQYTRFHMHGFTMRWNYCLRLESNTNSTKLRRVLTGNQATVCTTTFSLNFTSNFLPKLGKDRSQVAQQKMHSSCFLEIANSNANDAIHVPEPKEQTWPCSLVGMSNIFSHILHKSQCH